MNVAKTKWFVGGKQPADSATLSLLYAGQPIEWVAEFRYLGLVFTPEGHLSRMGDARLVAARKAWSVLQDKLG